MAAGDAMSSIKRDLPEAFWDDFDQIVGLLETEILRLGSLDPELRPFIFAWRKQGGDLLTSRSRDVVFRAIRPPGNVLAG